MFTGAKDQDKSQFLDHWAIVLSAQHADKNDWAMYAMSRSHPSILPILKAGEDLDFSTMTWEEFSTRFRNLSTAGSIINTAEVRCWAGE